MPIEFSCECGKAFKVADEYAGKRTKCTACGKPVVVPAPAVEESAEDAALRALTEGDDPEPAPRAAGSYSSRPEPAPPSSAVARPQTSTARKEPPPTYRSATAPPKAKPSPNWAKVIGGVVMAAIGVLVGVGAVSVYLSGGPVQRWAFIVPVPLVLAAPFFIIDGFRERTKK